MASEYSLALKATLDTSDVQQKLNQLKQQQASSGSNGGLGNGGIQQVLQRLNATLANLQRSIDKLSGQQGKQANPPGANRMPPVVPPNRWPTGGRRISPEQQTSLVAPLGLGKNLRIQQRKLVEAFGMGKGTPARQMEPVVREWRNFQKHGWTGKKLWKRLDSFDDYSMVEEWQQAQGSANQFQNRINNLRRRQVANNPTLAKEKAMRTIAGGRMSPQMKANLRMGAGLAFGTIAGGIENYAQATGNQGLATGAGFVQNIGYGAATGAMVGGPIGAVIGGSVGALTAAFDELARRARDASEALEGQAARVRSGRRFDIQLKDFEQQRQDKEMMKKQISGTSAERTEAGNYFRKELDEAKKKYDNVRANMEKTGIDAEGGVEAYEKRTKELLELRGKDDAEVKQRQQAVDIYKDQFYWLEKHSNRIEQLEDIVPKAPKAREFATSRFGLDPEKHPEIKDWTRYGAMGGVRGLAAAEQAKSLREALSNLKAPDMANVNSLASQGFMISAADDEARLDEANKHLTDLVNLTRQIKDKENEAATYG